MTRSFNPAADFRALFEGSPNLYLVLDPSLKIVAVNDAYCQATMTNRKVILGRDIFDVFPDNPSDPQATGVSNLRASLERVLQFKRPDAMALQKYDIPRPAAQGGGFEERYWSPFNSPVLDSRGEVSWIIHRVEDVTERWRTEDALKQETAFYDIVINNIPAMVFVKDAADLRFVIINRAGEELLGINRSEFIGKSDYDFFPKEQAEFFIAKDREVLRSGELQVTPEEPINTRQRGLRYLQTRKMAVPDEHGQPKYLLALSEDITERRQAEIALRASEARLNFLDSLSRKTAEATDANEILATTTRMLGQHLKVSNCAYADMEPDQDHFTIRGDWSMEGSPTIVGYYSLASFGRLAVKNLSAGLPLVVNDNLAELAPEEAAAFQSIGIAATVCVPLVKKGRLTALMAIHDRKPRIWNADEQALLGEVTERCWAHIARRQAEIALRESEIRLRGILLASPDAMIIVDKTGHILLASHRVELMFGYTSDELAGKSISMLLPEKYRHQHTAHIQGFMQNPVGRNMGTGRELNALRKDGSEFPVEINLSPAETSEGLVVIAAVRNVSASKSMEKQLRQAQKMEAIGNLTGGLAHDFNNLLGIIIGNLDLLRGQPGNGITKDPILDQLSSEALDAALRGADLTRRLLAFARRQALQPQRTDLNELIEGISKLLRRTLGTDIEIELNLEPEAWAANVDPSQLGASVINIVNNARDAMPSGGTLTIATSNRHLDEDYVAAHTDLAPGEYALIEISDTGTGIPAEFLNHIFDPFFTTKEQGKGTGLGLSMVFGFIKQSAGHINVYSEMGNGTTFRLYLPRDRSAAEAPEAPKTTMHKGHEAVLAVEDNEGLRRVVVRQLKELGYSVLEAPDGAAALKILEREPVDLLFTDIMMPGGMSGYDLAKHAVARWPALKVLLTSGFPETKLNGNGNASVKMHLLTKPYRKDDLASALRKALDGT
jgi:PAS domain S-box-containing protein